MLKQTDLALLRVLVRRGRAKYRELSAETGIPISTIYDRLKRLERLGVIRGYRAVIDEKYAGQVAEDSDAGRGSSVIEPAPAG